MKKLFLPILFILSIPLSAQSFDERALESYKKMEQVAQSVIKQAFSPMTNIEAGKGLVLFTPGMYRVTDLGENLDVEPRSLQGITLGAGGGYALMDRWMVYAIYAGMLTRGGLYSNWVGTQELDAPMTLDFHSLFLGSGYEVLSIPHFSLPVFIGVQGEFYDFSLKTDLAPSGLNLIESVGLEGQGFLWGFSGGTALDISLGRWSITPYYLYMYNMNGAELNASVKALVSTSTDYTLPKYQGGTLGLDIQIQSQKRWSFGASLANLFPQLKWTKDDPGFSSLTCYLEYRLP